MSICRNNFLSFLCFTLTDNVMNFSPLYPLRTTPPPLHPPPPVTKRHMTFFREQTELRVAPSTVQVKLSKFNFNFDDRRTYILQGLRDCRQITFIMPNGVFCLLSNKNLTPLFLTDEQYQDGQNTNQHFLHCVSIFEDTSYKNL